MVERLAAEPVVWAVATREPVRDEAVARTIDRLEHLDAVTFTIGDLASAAATGSPKTSSAGRSTTTCSRWSTAPAATPWTSWRRCADWSTSGGSTSPTASLPRRHRHRHGCATPSGVDWAGFRWCRRHRGRRSGDGRRVTDRGRRADRSAIGRRDAALRAAEDAQMVTAARRSFRHDLIREVVEVTLSATAP